MRIVFFSYWSSVRLIFMLTALTSSYFVLDVNILSYSESFWITHEAALSSSGTFQVSGKANKAQSVFKVCVYIYASFPRESPPLRTAESSYSSTALLLVCAELNWMGGVIPLSSAVSVICLFFCNL